MDSLQRAQNDLLQSEKLASLGSLVAGAVVVESVFSWPGVGRLLVSAVANRDLAVVQAILMVIAAWMVMANLTVDLAYGWLDPRVRGTAAAH